MKNNVSYTGGSALKRAFDIAAAAAGLALSAPVIAVAAAAMAVANRATPFFVQERIGRNGEAFNIIKIRTMKDTRDAAGNLLPEPLRTTAPGRLLRISRLDELPQMINVLRGDMSLVGPRPRIAREQMTGDILRASVRPGLTGLSQVFGLNALPLKDVLKKDRDYVRRLQSHGAISNFFYDLGILAETPAALIRHRKAPDYRRIAPPGGI